MDEVDKDDQVDYVDKQRNISVNTGTPKCEINNNDNKVVVKFSIDTSVLYRRQKVSKNIKFKS